MLEIVFAVLAATLGSGPAPIAVSADTATTELPAFSTEFDMTVVPLGLVAEPQTPSGRFTTASEVQPILEATKGNWIAVRAYDGQDLVYVSHLWAWRCGLLAVAVSINNAPFKDWPLPACHTGLATPNAILADDGLPYMTEALGSVQQVTVQVVYDDLTMDRASYARADVLIP